MTDLDRLIGEAAASSGNTLLRNALVDALRVDEEAELADAVAKDHKGVVLRQVLYLLQKSSLQPSVRLLWAAVWVMPVARPWVDHNNNASMRNDSLRLQMMQNGMMSRQLLTEFWDIPSTSRPPPETDKI